jgi:hypothetical protein
MTDIENVAELYYRKLSESKNVGVTLAQFYGSVFNQPVSKKEIIIFNRLVNIYGRFNVYFSILDMTSMTELNLENPYPLLSHFAKKRLDQKFDTNAIEPADLNRLANKLIKQLESGNKLVIPEFENE